MVHPFRAPRCVVTALLAGVVAGGAACSGDTTSPGTVAAVTLTPDTDSVAVGSTVRLQAKVTDANGSVVSGQHVFWNTENPAIATVSQDGVVTGVASGQVRISASAAGKSGIALVTVLPPPVSVVVVTPSLDTLEAGKTVALVATLLDSQGHPLGGRAVTWSSSAPDIASVDGTGLVTAIAAGSATITATSEGKSGSASIVVLPVPVAKVTVAPNKKPIIVGQSVQLTATARDSSGNVLSNAPITWSSSNDAIATVTPNGTQTAVVKGTGIGIATITAQSGPASGTSTITVGP